MFVMSDQGKKLKKSLIGKEKVSATRSLDEVVSALHKHKVFTNREAIEIVLNRPGGLDLTYYPSFPSLKINGKHVLSIRKCENGEYNVRHYFESRPDDYN